MRLLVLFGLLLFAIDVDRVVGDLPHDAPDHEYEKAAEAKVAAKMKEQKDAPPAQASVKLPADAPHHEFKKAAEDLVAAKNARGAGAAIAASKLREKEAQAARLAANAAKEAKEGDASVVDALESRRKAEADKRQAENKSKAAAANAKALAAAAKGQKTKLDNAKAHHKEVKAQADAAKAKFDAASKKKSDAEKNSSDHVARAKAYLAKKQKALLEARKKAEQDANQAKQKKDQASVNKVKTEAVEKATAAVDSAKKVLAEVTAQADAVNTALQQGEDQVEKYKKFASDAETQYKVELEEHNISQFDLVNSEGNPTLTKMAQQSTSTRQAIQKLNTERQKLRKSLAAASDVFVVAAGHHSKHPSQQTQANLKSAEMHLAQVEKQNIEADQTMDKLRQSWIQTNDKLEHTTLDSYLLERQLSGKLGPKELNLLNDRGQLFQHAKDLVEHAVTHYEDLLTTKEHLDTTVRKNSDALDKAVKNLNAIQSIERRVADEI